MKAAEFRKMGEQQKRAYSYYCAKAKNWGACKELDALEKYLDKSVVVARGRKVPRGTTGIVFWVGMKNYEGRSFTWHVTLGLKDKDDNVFFTDANNVDLP